MSIPITTHPDYPRYTFSTLHGFQFNGFKRESAIRILLLLGARAGMLNKDPNSSVGFKYRRAFNTKKGIMAQLVHYGIPHTQTDTIHELRERLINAAKDGKCDKQPAKLAKIQEVLQKINKRVMVDLFRELEEGKKARPTHLRLELVFTIPN